MKSKKKNNLKIIKKKIIPILKKNSVKKSGIFGSYSRVDEIQNSDIDVLIEPPKNTGFGFVRIQLELESKLKKKVDLLSYKAINHLLRDRILKEEVKIL